MLSLPNCIEFNIELGSLVVWIIIKKCPLISLFMNLHPHPPMQETRVQSCNTNICLIRNANWYMTNWNEINNLLNCETKRKSQATCNIKILCIIVDRFFNIQCSALAEKNLGIRKLSLSTQLQHSKLDSVSLLIIRTTNVNDFLNSPIQKALNFDLLLAIHHWLLCFSHSCLF
jgi:hypothetical protein